jgi:hypothetical protein
MITQLEMIGHFLRTLNFFKINKFQREYINLCKKRDYKDMMQRVNFITFCEQNQYKK